MKTALNLLLAGLLCCIATIAMTSEEEIQVLRGQLESSALDDGERFETTYRLVWLLRESDPTEGRRLLGEAMAMAQRAGRRKEYAQGQNYLGIYQYGQGEYARAEQSFTAAAQAMDALGEDQSVLAIQANLAAL